MKFREPGARKRPIPLPALLEPFSGLADLEEHARLVAPPGVLVLEEMPEAPLLQPDSIIGIERRPVLAPVHVEPFFLRRSSQYPFEVPARVQSLAAPVG